jgi:hypothetical protein
MASTINAITTGTGGVVTTADATGNLSLQTAGTTVMALTPGAASFTGTLTLNGSSVLSAGSTVTTAQGGTGLSSFTSGGAMYATSTSALTTGTLPTTAGGTGLTSFTSGGAVYASSTSALTTGTLPVASGGTGVTTSTGTGNNVLSASPTFTGQATIPTINLTGGQITFPATQSASADANTLDDYEEGTWTPIFAGSTTAGSCTYNTGATVANYVKIGQLVYTTFSIVATSTHSGTGTLLLNGLPFVISSASGWGGSPSIGYFGSVGVSITYISGYAGAGASGFLIEYTTAAQSTITNAAISLVVNNTHLIGTFVYRASS